MALGDFGRPAAIRLLVLVDRGGRELPIQADYAGLALTDISADYRVNVRLKEVDGVDEIVVEPRRSFRLSCPETRQTKGLMPTSHKPHWTRKHLLGLEELTSEELRTLLDTADSFKGGRSGR
ncbi:MAG: hypothetical protein QM767_28005 [Anaeromyxobacter sp.]